MNSVQVLQIKLLGKFQVTYENVPVATLTGARIQSLIAYLLLHKDTCLPRQQIAFCFWPESTERQAHTNLRKLLYTLRKSLPASERFFVESKRTIQWNIDSPYWCDFDELHDLIAQADGTRPYPQLLAELDKVYTGELLPICYDDWILEPRRTLHNAVSRLLDKSAGELEALQAFDEAILFAQRLQIHEPLHEQNAERLVRLHARTGNRTLALREYRKFADDLRRELDVDPNISIKDLVEEIKSGKDVSIATSEATVHEPDPKPNNKSTQTIRGLPLVTTPCIGRAHDLEKLNSILASHYCRLLTLYGPGGVGKTRLAVALAQSYIHKVRDGASYVSLVALQTPDGIAPAIAAAVQCQLVEGRRPEVQLLEFLRNKNLLLILDNIEHLLSWQEHKRQDDNPIDSLSKRSEVEVQELVEQILRNLPKIKIIVTSREPLNLYDEHMVEVRGLSTSEQDTILDAPPLPATNRVPRDTISAAEALFYHQMTKVQPDFAIELLSAKERTTVKSICG